MKKSINVKRIIKVLSLVIAVLVTTLYLQQFILVHYDGNRLRMEGFYLEKEDTIDVALIGSSDVYASFIPGLAYDKYGFTSYDYATASCTATSSVTQVKEVMRTQSPKLIVFEVNPFLYVEDENGEQINTYLESSVRNYIDNIPFDENKKDFLNTYVEPDKHIEYYLPFIKYHSAWNDYPQAIRYVRSCFDQSVRGYSYLKGFKTKTRIFKPLKKLYNDKLKADDKRADLSPDSEKHLRNFLDYCKKNNINIIFFRAPHIISVNSIDRVRRANKIGDIIGEYGFDYYNFERNFADLGIEPLHDFYNYDHMNIYGSEKFTVYLGRMISQKYSVGETKLDDEQKKLWEKSAKVYHNLYEYVDGLIKENEHYKTIEEDSDTINIIK